MALLIAGLPLACVSALVGSIAGVVVGGDSDAAKDRASAILGAAAFVLVIAVVVLLIVRYIRSADWIEGTRVSTRRFRTRTVDLTSARWIRLTADTVAPRLRTPFLVVFDGRTTVRIRLRDQHDGLLPPHEMRALADVISVATCPGAEDAQVWLRAVADDPRSLFS